MTEANLSELRPAGPRVVAFVNGLGGTPLGELYLVYDELASVLDQRGIEISRSLVGSYVTSLDMAGASITLLTLDDELLGWWDAPVQTPALRWGR
jgi:dihydroxyacetone kinase-like protein